EKAVAAAVIEISEGDSHGGLRAAFFVKSEAALVTGVLERAVMAIAVKIVGSGVIGDDEVDPTVIVQVGENGCKAIAAFAIGYSGFQANIGKRAVAVVVEEMVSFAQQSHGTAENVDATILAGAFGNTILAREDRAIEIKAHVSGNEQIKQAVVGVVAPRRTCGPSSHRYTRFFGNIGEGAIMIVVIEAVLAVIGDVNVGPAVIVVISDRRAKTPALISDAGLVCDVREGAIVIVVKEGGTRRRLDRK